MIHPVFSLRSLAMLGILVAHWVGGNRTLVAQSSGEIIQVGAATVRSSVPTSFPKPPEAKWFDREKIQFPATNQWFSSLIYDKYSRPHYAHPLAMHATDQGMRIGYPKIAANEKTVFGFLPATSQDLTVSLQNVPTWPNAILENHSDWFVTTRFESGEGVLRLTYGHGSPFVFLDSEATPIEIRFGSEPKIWAGGGRATFVAFTVAGNHYALFGPKGSTWNLADSKRWYQVSKNRDLSATLAVLPSATPEILKQFEAASIAKVTGSQMERVTSPDPTKIRLRFTLKHEANESTKPGSLFALLPHQWKHLTEESAKQVIPDLTYRSPRGDMKLLSGSSFEIDLDRPPLLTSLPLPESDPASKLSSALKQIADAPKPIAKETYWDGKEMGRLADALLIARELPDSKEQSAKITAKLREMLEDWFSTTAGPSNPDTRFLVWDKSYGTLLGYPTGFGAVAEMNDHHFHYGYFVWAAAVLALEDQEWASHDRYGAIVDLLCRDYAESDRESKEFPFLRTWDLYAGHSWASGTAMFDDGNNLESSSEAMLSAASLILWGKATAKSEFVDAGETLLALHLAAIESYWFDVENDLFPNEYKPEVAAIIWGGKSDFGTWFSAEPEMVYGINWLPIHGASIYLGRYPDYVKRVITDLEKRRPDKKWKTWADLIEMYRGLYDPKTAIERLESLPVEQFEPGNTPLNAWHWLYSLQQLGTIDRTIRSDFPLAAVFVKDGVRTYAAFNPTSDATSVKFSDGFELPCAGKGLHRKSK